MKAGRQHQQVDLDLTTVRYLDDVRTRAERVIGDPPMAGGEAATVMLALGVGPGLLRSIDPAIPVSGLTAVLRLVSSQYRSNRGAVWHAVSHD